MSLFYREDSIALAILRLIEVEKAVVEGAGATGLAAILSGHLPELAGKRLVGRPYMYVKRISIQHVIMKCLVWSRINIALNMVSLI